MNVRISYRVLMGKPEGKRLLARPRFRWEDNIKMGLQAVGCGGMDWIDVSQDRECFINFSITVNAFCCTRCI
jgi:hypothetical protein